MVVDELLMKAFDFLVIPESSLAWVFLGIFAVVFVYGLIRFGLCLSQLNEVKKIATDEKYLTESGYRNGDQLRNQINAMLTMTEVKIFDLPNIFLMIGVCGTFLGLGVAIQGAADLLSVETVDVAKLNGVLSVIAFKFQTSIWGTLLSLLFQKIFVDYYLVKKQEVIGDIESKMLTKESGEYLALDQLKGMRDDQSQWLKTLGEHLGAHTDKMSAMQNKQIDDLHRLTEQLVSKQLDMNNQLADQQLALLGDAVEDVRTSGKSVISNITDQLGQQRAYVEELLKRQNDLNAQLAEQQQQLLTNAVEAGKDNTQNLIGNIAQQLEQQREYVEMLMKQQIDLNKQMNEQQRVLLGDAMESGANNGKSIITNITDQLEQQRMYIEALMNKQNELNTQLAEQQKVLVGDAVEKFADNGQSIIGNIIEQLAQQRAYVEELMNNQNALNQQLAEQQRMLIGDAMEDVKSSGKSVVSNMTEQMEQQRAHIETLLERQNELNNQLAEQQRVLVGDAMKDVKDNNQNVVMSITDQLGQQRDHIETLLERQNDLNNQLAEQQRVLVGDAMKDVKDNNENVIVSITEKLDQQQDHIKTLLDQQNDLNNQLVEQQKMLVGDAMKDVKDNNENVIMSITEKLDKQQDHIKTLLDQQNDLNNQLAEQQRVLIGDTMANVKNNSDTVIISITEQLAQQRAYVEELLRQQNDLNAQLAEQQKILMGDTMEGVKSNNENVIVSITEQLAQQRAYVEALLDKQNDLNRQLSEQQKMLVGDAVDHFTTNGQSIIATITDQLARQREYVEMLMEKQTDLNNQLAEQQRLLIGDAVEAGVSSNKSLIASITEQLAQQRAYVETLLEKQTELNNQLAEQQRVLIGDAMEETVRNNKSLLGTITEQLEQQREYVETLLEKQTDLNNQLANQQKLLLGDAVEATMNSGKSVVSDITDQLAQQRAYIETLIEKQNDLNNQLALQQKALIGDAIEEGLKNGKSIVENIADQLAQQRSDLEQLLNRQIELSGQLAEQQNAAIGDAITDQLGQQREYVQDLIEKQTTLNAQLAEEQKLLLGNALQDHLASQRAVTEELNNNLVDQQKSILGNAMDDVKNNNLSVIDNISDQLGQQRAYVEAMLGKQNEMNNQLADQQKALIGDAMENVKASGKSVLSDITDQLAQQRDYVEELLRKQNDINAQLAEQQSTLVGDAISQSIENGKSILGNITDQLGQQRADVEALLAKQNDLNKQLADQQQALIGDAMENVKASGKSIIADITDQLAKQRADVEALLAKQNDLNNQLAEQQSTLVGDAISQSLENGKSILGNITDQLGQQRADVEALLAKQNDLNRQLADQQQALIGDAMEDVKASGKSIIADITDQLAKQRVDVEALLAKQNDLNNQLAEQQSALVGDAITQSLENGKSILGNITDQLNQQRADVEALLAKQNDLNRQLADQQQALIGDAMEDVKASGKSVLSDITDQLGQQRDYVEEMLQKQNDLNAQLAAQQAALMDDVISESLENGKSILGNITDQLNQQRADVEALLAKQNELNAQLAEQQNALLGDVIDDVKASGKSVLGDITEQLAKQRADVEALLAKQNDLNNQLAQQQSTLVGDAIAQSLENGKSILGNITDQLAQQRAYVEDLLQKQNELNAQIAEQQQALIGDAMEDVKASGKSVIADITDKLQQQRLEVEELLEKQNELNAQLTEHQQALLGDVMDDVKASGRSVIADITDKLQQQRADVEALLEKQNELNAKVAEQQAELVGDALAETTKNGQSILGNITDLLNQQRADVEALLAKQNALNQQLAEQQQALIGDAVAENLQNGKSLIGNITEQLEQQRDYVEALMQKQTELNAQLAEQQNTLFGDAVDDVRANGKSILSNITEQLAQQRAYVEALLEKQNELNAQLAEQNKALIGDAIEAGMNNGQSILANIADQLAQQREFMRELTDKQSQMFDQLTDQQKQLLDDSEVNIAGQLEEQRKHMDDMLGQQERLNRALLGDIQEAGDNNAKSVREGFIHEMEKYKEFAQALAEEQNRTQKALDEKLGRLSDGIDENSRTQNSNIEELRRAIDLLQTAIDNNSKTLQDIINTFYDKQNDLDALRRSEIMGMVENFTTLLHQEGNTTAPWRRRETRETTDTANNTSNNE